MGRFVEVYGIYPATNVLGDSVWRRFDDFKRFIHPARRRELEPLVRRRMPLAARGPKIS